MANEWKIHFEKQLNELPSDWGLFQVLDRGLISPSSYLDWAKEYYGMAALKPEYFAKHQVNFDIWQKWKDQIQANPELVPLCEWDHQLIVLCFEPPTQLNHSLLIPLLCDFSYMSTLWQTYQLHEASLQQKNQNDEVTIIHGFVPPPPPTQKTPPVLNAKNKLQSPLPPTKKTQVS